MLHCCQCKCGVFPVVTVPPEIHSLHHELMKRKEAYVKDNGSPKGSVFCNASIAHLDI